MGPIKEFIAAIELGSSKITGIAGRKNSDGSIHVLACVSEESSSFIRRGVVYNLDIAAHTLTAIIAKLAEMLDARIAKVYVGIGGQSLCTVKNVESERLDTKDSVITQNLLDSIHDKNREKTYPEREILEVIPQEYKIGSNFSINPVGNFGDSVEARFMNILASVSLKYKLDKAFEAAGTPIVDYFIAPLALAEVLLEDTEKRSGCVLVDLGAETTTVSVYKNNILRHLAVIPLGGRNITKDICDLQVEEEEAESLKIGYGGAVSGQEKDSEPSLITLQSGRVIKEDELNNIIEARVEEIIANIKNQIDISEYKDKLIAGIIITGGGANLRKLADAFQKMTDKKVRIAKDIIPEVKVASPDMVKKNGMYNTILALLCAGQENCCEPQEEIKVELKEEEPKPLDALLIEEKELNPKTKNVEKKEPVKKADKSNGPGFLSSFMQRTKKQAEDISRQLFTDDPDLK